MLGTNQSISDRSSRGVDPERLRMLSKKASRLFTDQGIPLTDAVVGVLREESSLNQEHVKRVVEMTNNAAYSAQEELIKNAGHKVINFDSGPADSEKVIQNLRSESQGGVMKTAAQKKLMSHERFIPGQDGLAVGPLVKTAARERKPDYPFVDPYREVYDVREKLAAAVDQLTSQLIRLQVTYDEATESMTKAARDLILSGHSPVEVSRVYADRAPNPVFTKLALKMVRDCVTDVPAQPLSKTAGWAVNPEHPLCTTFDHFVKVAAQFFTTLAAVERTRRQQARVEHEIKQIIQ
jgi:hypothetical protein